MAVCFRSVPEAVRSALPGICGDDHREQPVLRASLQSAVSMRVRLLFDRQPEIARTGEVQQTFELVGWMLLLRLNARTWLRSDHNALQMTSRCALLIATHCASINIFALMCLFS